MSPIGGEVRFLPDRYNKQAAHLLEGYVIVNHLTSLPTIPGTTTWWDRSVTPPPKVWIEYSYSSLAIHLTSPTTSASPQSSVSQAG